MLNENKIILGVFILILSFTFSIKGLADESQMPVVIKTILPDNQINKEVEYFDLKMTPLAKQKVKIQVSNMTEEPINFKLRYSNAKTTSNGVIEYSENGELKLNTPVGYSFTEILSGPDDLNVPAKKTEEVEFLISMPEKIYDGSIAGGVEFIQETSKSEEGALVAQRSYLVGFKMSETETKVATSIDLGKTFVGTKNYKSAIVVPLINLNGEYIEELSVSTEIMQKDDKTIVMKDDKQMMRMAPFSILEFPIYFEETIHDVGEYVIKVKIEAEKDFKKEWEQSFNVTKKDYALMNEYQQLWHKDIEKSSKRKVFFLVVITIVTLLVSSLIVLKYISNKKVKGDKNGKKKKYK